MLIFLVGIAFGIYWAWWYFKEYEMKIVQGLIAIVLILASLIIPGTIQEERPGKEFELVPLIYSKEETKNVYITQDSENVWKYRIKTYTDQGKLSKETQKTPDIHKGVEVINIEGTDNARVEIFEIPTSMTWYSMGITCYERYVFYVPK